MQFFTRCFRFVFIFLAAGNCFYYILEVVAGNAPLFKNYIYAVEFDFSYLNNIT